MTTSAASAKHWLETQGINEPRERIEQIAQSMLNKLAKMDDEDPQQQGLIEALAVVEDYLASLPVTPQPNVSWDTDPLGDPPADTIPQLTQAEKQQQFKQLLKQQK
ncbi:hypothetical protein H0A36_08160 [Endozoicomonas sp. SM1973]|uniref:Uncharacterized protein n=1 Tax=Spartinivicinus marinus TaxID=2994442 RepID=A0A853I9P2_9GAMM|nr:hypothetical protein [Spartinivicinus marinus]MCX4025264.1 hypothetical protein [Spartinivicinus marinus]NYZ65985.1 hypothetical protein [Spartinivicinus marinus]